MNKKLEESATKVAEDLKKVIADKDSNIEDAQKAQRILEDKINRKGIMWIY